jgi:hypothetical protein
LYGVDVLDFGLLLVLALVVGLDAVVTDFASAIVLAALETHLAELALVTPSQPPR